MNQEERISSCTVLGRRYKNGEAHLPEADTHKSHVSGDDEELGPAVVLGGDQILLHQLLFPEGEVGRAEE